jgi:hypothetical protein
MGKKVKQDFKDVFAPIPHMDDLPTDVFCHIKLKDASKNIATHTPTALLASTRMHG